MSIYYRCKHPATTSGQHGIAHPPVLYLRQESIADPVDHFLNKELGQTNLTETLRRIADASHSAALAKHQQRDEAPKLCKTIADCDTKIAQYRATLDAGGDPTLVAGWISETANVRKAAQARLGLTEAPPERMTEEQLMAAIGPMGMATAFSRPSGEGHSALPPRSLQGSSGAAPESDSDQWSSPING